LTNYLTAGEMGKKLDDNSLETRLRRGIIAAGVALTELRLIAAGEGNISVRAGTERVLITPSGARKGKLSVDEIVTVDLTGRVVGPSSRTPSSELGLHLCVYQNRPDLAACVHAHPPYAVACSVAGLSLNRPVLPEIIAAVGGIGTAGYATPSTPEMAESIMPLIGDHDAIVLKNHGVLTGGPDLDTALARMELVEHLAQVVFLASQLGHLDYLTDEQIGNIRRIAGR
jgi:L-fuculose-phosphate aldolase